MSLVARLTRRLFSDGDGRTVLADAVRNVRDNTRIRPTAIAPITGHPSDAQTKPVRFPIDPITTDGEAPASTTHPRWNVSTAQWPDAG